MKACIECGAELNPEDPPRYDVFSEGYNPDDPTDRRGPYCAADFAATATGEVASEPPPIMAVDEPAVD